MDDKTPRPSAPERSTGPTRELAVATPALLPPGEHEDAEAPQALEPEPAAGDDAAAKPPARRLLVVGIGASAGGLDALDELMPHLPRDDMAFIVVQHLSPDHESQLPQLLARGTTLEVATATDGATIEPGHVYVIPPNTDLAVLHGVIRHVTPPQYAHQHLPIDYLFRSIADDVGASAIGVVLSGTGTDGTFGLQAIKAAGGLTFAQDPATARYDGMPRSALASGAVDVSLPPRGIGEALARFAAQPPVRPRVRVPPAPQARDELGKLFVLIRAEFGNDLTSYKQTTIERRIERRMTLHRLQRLADYVRLVHEDRAELRALYKDLLITVTSFFRDPDAFEALKQEVFPKLFERVARSAPVRVWVPACATGEEAYSLAMAMVEFCEDHGREPKLQIFGTDLDEDCVQHARHGIYAANIAADVSPERLNRFFVRKDTEYQISRRIRDMLVFSRQNVLKDAPFSRIDLVSCRNLLIYLLPAAQKTVLRILHYALNPAGCLFLGISETVGDAPELFTTIDRKHKIYSKKQVAAQIGIDVAFGAPRAAAAPPPVAPPRPALNLQSLADRKVLELYGPPSVIISEAPEILQFRGHTGPYLDPSPGHASLNLLKIVRFELHIELKRAIEEAIAQKRRVTAEATYTDGERRNVVALDVVPLQDPATEGQCLLVLFRPRPQPREVPVATIAGGEADSASASLARRIEELERELELTKQYLQATVEEKESTLEELKSANEELQSSNEELQSTNEELETSKEEMQSTNEELTTVNDELQSRMAELSQTNDDLHNVLAGVDNVVVIVGMNLRIRRYTAAAERLFNLVPGDLGRSIDFLDPFLGGYGLEAKISGVIQSLATHEEDVLASNRRWYALKITPYKTLDHAIRGALMTMIDVDVRKRAIEVARDVGAYADRFLAPISHPLLIIDRRRRVVWCNEPFLSELQLTRDEVVGSLLDTLGARRFDDAGLGERVERVFASGAIFRGYVLQPGGDLGRAVEIAGSQVPAASGTALALLSFEPAARRAPPGLP